MGLSLGMQMLKVFFEALMQVFIFLWPIWIVLVLIAFGRFVLNQFEKQRLSKSGIYEIDKMDGKTFEKYLEVLFERLGYKVHRIRYIGDYGADLVTTKNGVKTVIQAKRFKNNVGIKAIQEAVAAKGIYKCTEAMVVTNSYYTKQAFELARADNVKLWNRDDLIKALLSIKKNTIDQEKVQKINDSSFGNNEVVSKCAYCGRTVSEKVRDFCLANSNRFGGKIYCYDHQKSN